MFRTTSRRRRTAVTLIAAAIAAGALATVAIAASFTLKEAKHATVVNQKMKVTHPNVVVNSRGFVVYTLTGDSRKHPECVKSNSCLSVWPPVTVKSMKSLSKAPGVKGKLSTWKRFGFIQVLINGHPLYTFVVDTKKGVATGEGIVHFGGTWHVQKASGSGKASSAPASSGNGW